jgi:hypothetical protein
MSDEPVGAAVVRYYDFARDPVLVKHPLDLCDAFRQSLSLVEARHDHGQFHRAGFRLPRRLRIRVGWHILFPNPGVANPPTAAG